MNITSKIKDNDWIVVAAAFVMVFMGEWTQATFVVAMLTYINTKKPKY